MKGTDELMNRRVDAPDLPLRVGVLEGRPWQCRTPRQQISGTPIGRESEQNDPGLFGAQVAALSVPFPETRTVVIPPHETWMDSLPNYTGNETVSQNKAGTLVDRVIIGGCSYQTVPMDSEAGACMGGIGRRELAGNRGSNAKMEKKTVRTASTEPEARKYRRRLSQFP